MSLPSPKALARIPFVRDLVTMQLGKAVPIVTGLLSSILFPNLLGLEGYGQYAVVLSLVGVLGIVTNLGQQNAALAFLAEAYGKKDTAGMRSVGRYYFTASAAMILLLLILLPILPELSVWMYGNDAVGRLAQIVFLASMLDPLFNYCAIILQTVREIRFLTILENTYTVVQLGLSVLLILRGWGVAGMLWGSTFTSLLSVGVALCILPGVERRYRLPRLWTLLIPDFKAVKTYASAGFWIAIDKNVGNLYPNLFMVALSTRAPQSAVGLVRLAYKFANLPSSLVLSNISRLASSVVPTLMGEGRRVRDALLRLLRSTVLVHVLASAGAAACIPLLFPLFYGQGFGDALRPFWAILVLQLPLAIHALLTPVLRTKNRVYWATIFNCVGFAAGLGAFYLTAQSILSPLWAFTLALAVYQSIAICIVFPVARLLHISRRSIIPA